MMITYMWCIKVPLIRIVKDLRISKQAAVDWSSFCREVCVHSCIDNCDMLGGEGKVVEIDESKFGKRKFNRGRLVEGKWVFGRIERGSDKCFTVVVKEKSREVLIDIIKKYVRPKTTIISDYWSAYSGLQ
ncbi:hypothetical protein J437_LFUL018762 [Ladona fulva]|uniref:ISXO2-like transposase domain-containing protein n=1 Tax=Ladona fulva TaxID=123851 RepID=A0A8K0PBL4_LADFU|nr:hypothetical protein J437_LFUL018762 [Ladona fulva]